MTSKWQRPSEERGAEPADFLGTCVQTKPFRPLFNGHQMLWGKLLFLYHTRILGHYLCLMISVYFCFHTSRLNYTIDHSRMA